MKAGQLVSIAVLNLNSNIPTIVVTEKVIKAETPGLVSLAKSIASSQDLAKKVAAFVDNNDQTFTTAAMPTATLETTLDSPSSSPSSSGNVVGITLLPLLSWVGLLLLPLDV